MTATKSLGPLKDRPTLLMVGRGEPMDAALRVALDRHGLFVEEASSPEAANAVRTAAPDLVLLVGDASRDGGRAVLEKLSKDVATSVVPVALLCDEGGLDKRLMAFRFGAIAAVPRSASADEIARRVAQLARELPERETSPQELGEATFDELVALVTRELRSGILTVGRQGGDPMRIVLGAGRPVAEAVQEFVQRLRPLVSRAEPLVYEFHRDGGGGTIGLLDAEPTGRADLTIFDALRVLLVDNDPGRTDALAQELRGRGAQVAVTDTAGRGLERAQGLDPEVVIVDAAGIEGPGFDVVRQLRRDPRLRWASILVAPWEELWPDPRGNPDVERLAERIAPLVVNDRALRERATAQDAFDTRLESTGPCRLLRVLAGMDGTFHVTLRSSKAVVEVDVAQGLVVGASGGRTGGETFEGTPALAAVLAMGSGRVHVERRSHPTSANVMAPVDEALARASQEASPIAPSTPPPASSADAKPTSSAPGRRRPFPNASELGRADALFSTVGTESEADLSGPVDVPSPTMLASGSGSARPGAADLKWGDSSAEPKASARAVPPPAAPQPAAQARGALPQGVLGSRGGASLVPRPAPTVPRPAAGPAPPKKTSGTLVMGVLRGSAQSQQGLPAVRVEPPTPPRPSATGSDAPREGTARTTRELAPAARPSDQPVADPPRPGASRTTVDIAKSALSSRPPVTVPVGAPVPSATPIANDAARALAAATQRAAGSGEGPTPPPAAVARVAPKKTLVGLPPQRGVVEEQTDAGLLGRDRRSEDSTQQIDVQPPVEAKRSSTRLPELADDPEVELARRADGAGGAEASTELTVAEIASSEMGSSEISAAEISSAEISSSEMRSAEMATAELGSGEIVTPSPSNEASAVGGLPAGSLPPPLSAPSSTSQPARAASEAPVAAPAGALPTPAARTSAPPRRAAGRGVARAIGFLMLAAAIATVVGVGGMIAARRLGLVGGVPGATEPTTTGEPASGGGEGATTDVEPGSTGTEAPSAAGAGTGAAAEGATTPEPAGTEEPGTTASAGGGETDTPPASGGGEATAEGSGAASGQAPAGTGETVPSGEAAPSGGAGSPAEAVAEGAGSEGAGEGAIVQPATSEPGSAPEPAAGGEESVEQLLERARTAPAPMAETYYRRALALDPQSHYAMIGLARLLLARGAASEALPFAEDAVRRRSRRAPYRVLLGDVRHAAGDEAGAREAWEAALEIEPENRDALQRLGR